MAWNSNHSWIYPFRFVHARDSRSRLYTTRQMLMLAFTYFQVTPEFLDFLFPFGRRARAQDLHFRGFRQQTRLSSSRQGLQIDELGWSGRDLQVCYNFKSVERSSSQVEWPWSIRHCAICHSFDVKHIRSTWIVVKGDQLIQKRIVGATSQFGPPEFRNFHSIDRAFAASLAVHLVLCTWSVENWRWYINFFEEKFQEISRRTISNEIDVSPLSPTSETRDFTSLSRAPTDLTQRSIFSILSSKRARSQTWGTLSPSKDHQSQRGLRVNTNFKYGPSQPHPNERGDIPLLARNDGPKYDEYGQKDFSFGDLQAMHHIDKRANEAALVISHNQEVLTQLSQYYRTIYALTTFPDTIRGKCDEDMQDFEMQVSGIETDFRIQASRIETLLRLISDCKSLVNCQYPSVSIAC